MPGSKKAAALRVGMHPLIPMAITVGMPSTSHPALNNLHSLVPLALIMGSLWLETCHSCCWVGDVLAKSLGYGRTSSSFAQMAVSDTVCVRAFCLFADYFFLEVEDARNVKSTIYTLTIGSPLACQGLPWPVGLGSYLGQFVTTMQSGSSPW